MRIVDLLREENLSIDVSIFAWVKGIQAHGKILFLHVNDGSTLKNLQSVYKKSQLSVTIGSAVKLVGKLKKSLGSEQDYELLCDEIEILSLACPTFPIQKNTISFHTLREIPHQQHRTQVIHAISLIKHELIHAIHNFFYDKKFLYIKPPIFTSSSCEGGSEVFELNEEGTSFFKQKTLLSVSGQFYAEAAALGFKDVYVLSPTFRSEKSNSTHHLAEFWMLEIEMNFSSLQDMLKLMEEFLKTITKKILEKCHYELSQLQKMLSENHNLIDKLNQTVNTDFAIVEYSDAIKILKEEVEKEKAVFFNSDIVWGMNLASEHERYLSQEIYKAPVFVINYPKPIKAFYMKQNEDNQTVAAVDLLLPGIGELIGGSERETDVEKIKENAKSLDVCLDDYGWYLDLRKYGYHKSSGFGLGLERLVMWFTGIKNIKDATLFPRSYKNLHL